MGLRVTRMPLFRPNNDVLVIYEVVIRLETESMPTCEWINLQMKGCLHSNHYLFINHNLIVLSTKCKSTYSSLLHHLASANNINAIPFFNSPPAASD